ncbi:MAG: Stp1/IreP family PP2C-type Ser/Thr phosphatase [Elusimicrobiota bacterium]
MKISSAGLTDPGQVRRNNEDSYWVEPETGLYIVADGMGGHAAGEVASRMAVEVIREQVSAGLASGRIPAVGDKMLHVSQRARLLGAAVQMANDVIFSAAQENLEKKGMGTTLVAILLDKSRFAVAHVGDSRLYLHRSGRLEQLTRDHSVVAEQVARGLITAAQAETSDLRNVLSRALGVAPEVRVDVDEHPFRSGDSLLLCSDGLYRVVPDDDMGRELARRDPPAETCRRLVEAANGAGGPDNITVVLIRREKTALWPRIAGYFNPGKGLQRYGQAPS